MYEMIEAILRLHGINICAAHIVDGALMVEATSHPSCFTITLEMLVKGEAMVVTLRDLNGKQWDSFEENMDPVDGRFNTISGNNKLIKMVSAYMMAREFFALGD